MLKWLVRYVYNANISFQLLFYLGLIFSDNEITIINS
jgi:hypothetical protein